MFKRPLLLLALGPWTAIAATLMPAAPDTGLERPIFAPGLCTGHPIIGLIAAGPSLPGKSTTLGLEGAFKLGHLEDPRESGWELGFRATASENYSEMGTYLAPASYSVEVAFGRASIAPEFERKSGLRGFIELSYRLDRVANTDLGSAVLNSLAGLIPQRNTWIGMKSGAGTDLSGLTLGTHEHKNFLWRSFLSGYFPISGTRIGMFSAEFQTLFHCSWVDCGGLFHYDYYKNTSAQPSVEEMKHLFGLGFRIEKHFPSDEDRSVFVSFEGIWVSLNSNNMYDYSNWPILKLEIFKTF